MKPAVSRSAPSHGVCDARCADPGGPVTRCAEAVTREAVDSGEGPGDTQRRGRIWDGLWRAGRSAAGSSERRGSRRLGLRAE